MAPYIYINHGNHVLSRRISTGAIHKNILMDKCIQHTEDNMNPRQLGLTLVGTTFIFSLENSDTSAHTFPRLIGALNTWDSRKVGPLSRVLTAILLLFTGTEIKLDQIVIISYTLNVIPSNIF